MIFKLSKPKKQPSKTYSIGERPSIGDIRVETYFATLPMKVDNCIIWLEKYEKTYEYVELPSKLFLKVSKSNFKIYEATYTINNVYGWVLTEEKIIKN